VASYRYFYFLKKGRAVGDPASVCLGLAHLIYFLNFRRNRLPPPWQSGPQLRVYSRHRVIGLDVSPGVIHYHTERSINCNPVNYKVLKIENNNTKGDFDKNKNDKLNINAVNLK
jgi:hypothetical protein